MQTLETTMLTCKYHDPAVLNREELSALSTLVCFSWDSEEASRDRGNHSNACEIRESRDMLREVLRRTEVWERK